MSANKWSHLSLKEQNERMRKALARKSGLTGRGAYKGFVGTARLSGHGDYKKRSFSRRPYKGMRGRGDFFDDLGSLGKGLAGRLIDTGVGVVRGGVGKLLGSGDYRRIAPRPAPRFATKGRVNHFAMEEYLGNIYSSVDFAATTFNVNPGLGDPASLISGARGAFPWLARIAQQYEQYRIHGMVFSYVPTSSDAVVASATTPGLGSVSIASEFNVNKPDFTNLTDMLNHQMSISEKPSVQIEHAIECATSEQPLKVYTIRNDNLSSGELLMYDYCKTTVAVQGCQADGQELGQLWVSYDVELLKPILEDQGGDPFTWSTHYKLPTTIATTTAYFGTTPPDDDAAEDGSTFVVTFGGTTITLPDHITSGHFSLTYYVVGSSTSLTTALNVGFTTNCSGLTIFANDSTAIGGHTPSGATSTFQCCTRFFKVTGPGAVLTFSGGTMPASITSGDLLITQINDDIVTLPECTPRGIFWRPTKDYPNPPWKKEVTEEQKKELRAQRTDELASLLRDLLAVKQLAIEAPKETDDSKDEFTESDLALLRRIKAEQYRQMPSLSADKSDNKEELPAGYVKVKAPSTKGTKG